MAQNTTLSVPAGTWTQITDADVTSITFQVSGDAIAYIAGAAGTTAPTDTVGAIRYSPNQGELNAPLADLFPGISAARVWVFATSNISVFVSHA